MKSLKRPLLLATFCMLTAGSAFADEAEKRIIPPNYPAEENTPLFYPLTCGWLANKAVTGNVVALGDGSQWKISPDFVGEVQDWKMQDPIFVSPNYTPFSAHTFWLQNKRTGSSAMANLFLGPEEFGQNSHWIAHIDRPNHVVFIENRVGFDVDARDRDLLADWSVRDTVIVGVSNSWYGSSDHILINVNLNQFVRGRIY